MADHRRTCDIGAYGNGSCGGKQKLDVYIDGRVRGGSRWANMCPDCFREVGLGLGLGIGQMFKWNAERGMYEKVAG